MIDDADSAELRDRRNFRRPAVTSPGYHAGRIPANAGKTYATEVVTPGDVQTLLNGCPKTPGGLRLRAYIILLYRTGIDPVEAQRLRTQDLDLQRDHASVYVSGGRLKERTLALDASVMEHLRPWLKFRSTLPNDALLCVLEGRTAGLDWSSTGARKEVVDLGDRLLNRRVVPGHFRSTLAAELMIEQWPLTYIQVQLGLTGVWSFQKIFDKLRIRLPDESEVQGVSRTRPPWNKPTAAP